MVIQEYWGLEPHIRKVVERFAEASFIALAPDLFHGKVPIEPNEAQKLAMELDMSRVVKEISGAAQFLVSLEDVEPKKVAVIGFCMGGRLALTFGASSELVGAISAFYPGRYNPSLDQARQLRAPALIHFGADDHSISEETRRQVEQTLRAAGKTVECFTYTGAPHSFFNDSKSSYRPEAARLAWERTISWFSKYLEAVIASQGDHAEAGREVPRQ